MNDGRKTSNGEVNGEEQKTEIVTAITIAETLDKKSIKIMEEESRGR
jgi:hypothetical protein